MIALVLLLAFAVVLLVCSFVWVVRAGRQELAYRRARRDGVELEAQVVSELTSRAGRAAGAYDITPVVRYRLGERDYEAALVNAPSGPRDRGTGMTIVVSPDRPYEPYDRFQGLGRAARGA